MKSQRIAGGNDLAGADPFKVPSETEPGGRPPG
jgi:hypothetical protein